MRVSSVTGPPGVCTVSPSTSCEEAGHRRGRHRGDAEVDRVGRRQRLVGALEHRVLAARVEPALDRRLETGGQLVGVQQVERVERPGLRPRGDPGERRGVHQQQARSRRGRRGGADPGEHRHVEVGDPLGERDAVLAERARGVELQHDDRAVALGLREAVVEVGERRAVDRTLDPQHDHGGGFGARRGTARERDEQCSEHGGGQGHATHRVHRTRRQRGVSWAQPSMPQSSVPRRPDPRPISDRPAFKPLAVDPAGAHHPAGERPALDRDRAPVPGGRARRDARRREARDPRRRLHPHPALPRALHDLRERRQDRARHGLPRQPRAHPPEGREQGRAERRARDRGLRSSTSTARSTGARSCGP